MDNLVTVLIAMLGGALFTIVTVAFPTAVMRILSPDPMVIDVGSRYLRLIGLGYLPYALTTSYVSALRSTHFVKIPMVASMLAISLLCPLILGG